jgi:hypothetical protein
MPASRIEALAPAPAALLEALAALGRLAGELGPAEGLGVGGRRGGRPRARRLLFLLGADGRRDRRSALGALSLDEELGVLAQASHIARLREVEECEHGKPDEGRQPRERA